MALLTRKKEAYWLVLMYLFKSLFDGLIQSIRLDHKSWFYEGLLEEEPSSLLFMHIH